MVVIVESVSNRIKRKSHWCCCAARLEPAGDRLRRNVGTRVSRVDAEAQALAQLRINLANPANRRLDRLGHGEPRVFRVRPAPVALGSWQIGS
jgi:hypothetical protein